MSWVSQNAEWATADFAPTVARRSQHKNQFELMLHTKATIKHNRRAYLYKNAAIQVNSREHYFKINLFYIYH
jgi:hypothetical protein